MKKFVCICLLVLAMVCMLMPVFAIAEDLHPPEAVDTQTAIVAADNVETVAEPEPQPVPGEPLTWAYLATIAGATAATCLIVQFLKVPLDKVWKIPTRAFVYFIALAILLVATAFTTGLTPDTALLTVVNAFIVALTAYGSYEVTFKKIEH